METSEAQRKQWVAASVLTPFFSLTVSVANSIDLTVVAGGTLAPTNQLFYLLCAAWLVNDRVNPAVLSPPGRRLDRFVDREWSNIAALQRYKWLTYELDNGAPAIGPNGKIRALKLRDYSPALRQAFKRAAIDSGVRRSMLGIPYAASRALLGRFATRRTASAP